MDFDTSATDIDHDIENIRLLRKQLHSVQTIRKEQQRKDDLISRLKERIQQLEMQQVTYEALQDEFIVQTRRISEGYAIREGQFEHQLKETTKNYLESQEQLAELQEINAEYERKLNEACTIIKQQKSKIIKYKSGLQEQKQLFSAVSQELNRTKRDSTEKESALAIELNIADQKLCAFQSLIKDKEEKIQLIMNDSAILHSIEIEKCQSKFQESELDISRWEKAYSELNQRSNAWKSNMESALEHEKASLRQEQEINLNLRAENTHLQTELQDLTSNQLRLKEEKNEQEKCIRDLSNTVEKLSIEIINIRETAQIEKNALISEKETELIKETGFLKNEIGALQVGLVLQKEMKDEVQNNLSHIRQCLRSLAIDLSTALQTTEDFTTVCSRCSSLCDLFDRLLLAGTYNSPIKLSADSHSYQIDDISARIQNYMHNYPDQSRTPIKSNGVHEAERRQTFSTVDPEFLSVIRSLKDILRKINLDQVSLSRQQNLTNSSKSEINKLIDHINLLSSDLNESDLLIFTLVRQLVDERFVDANGLKELSNFEDANRSFMSLQLSPKSKYTYEDETFFKVSNSNFVIGLKDI